MNELINEKNVTEYVGRYLGCIVKDRKRDDSGNLPKGKDGKEASAQYGQISLVFFGTRTDTGSPWFLVKDEYVSVERMEELTKNVPFDSKAKFTYETGVTPGAKQRLSSIEVIK